MTTMTVWFVFGMRTPTSTTTTVWIGTDYFDSGFDYYHDVDYFLYYDYVDYLHDSDYIVYFLSFV